MSRHPVDRGWAWMVCLGTGVQAFFVIGGLKCMGIIFVEILEIFDAPLSVTSLTLGLVAGGFAVFAMLSNALSVMIGMRFVTLCGAVMLALSFFLAMFKVNVWYTVMMLGLVSGMSLGAMLTPAVLLLSQYFDRWKAFSNGLAMAGSSVGQLTLPYMIRYLLDEYGYSGAMLIYSAIAMNAIPAAMLLFPTTFWDRRRKSVHRKKPLNLPIRAKSPADEQNNLHDCSDHEIRPHCDLKPKSVLQTAAVSLVPGASVESLNLIGLRDHRPPTDQTVGTSHVPEGYKFGKIRFRPVSMRRFCGLIFDRDLLRSPCLWLLFFALGFGHAGFIDAMLHLPTLAYEVFEQKGKGAMLMTITGFFDLCGRVGGGWFADQGYMSSVAIIILGFTVSGSATILVTFHPVLWSLITYCVVMGIFGGLYRILLPVVVGDLFGRHKTGPGVGMLFMSLGLLIVPVPPFLGYMRQVFGTYLPAFQFCGGLLLLGSTLLVLILFVKKYDKAVLKPTSSDDTQSQSVTVPVNGNSPAAVEAAGHSPNTDSPEVV